MGNLRNSSLAVTTAAVIVVILVVSVFAVGVGYAVAQTDDSQDPAESAAFVVELESDGDAEVLVRHTFDLDDEARQAAFEELQTSESEQAMFTDRFEDRMTAIAADVNAETDRETSVTNATLELETVDETGIATLSITWQGLAAVDDDRLVLTEPFASGFESDRPFHVVAPDGYTIHSASPQPAESNDGSVVWNEGANLTGFEVVATADTGTEHGETGTESDDTGTNSGSSASDADDSAADDPADETADDDGSGFGVLVALGGVGAFLFRRML